MSDETKSRLPGHVAAILLPLALAAIGWLVGTMGARAQASEKLVAHEVRITAVEKAVEVLQEMADANRTDHSLMLQSLARITTSQELVVKKLDSITP